jgi:hypothetical protein
MLTSMPVSEDPGEEEETGPPGRSVFSMSNGPTKSEGSTSGKRTTPSSMCRDSSVMMKHRPANVEKAFVPGTARMLEGMSRTCNAKLERTTSTVRLAGTPFTRIRKTFSGKPAAGLRVVVSYEVHPFSVFYHVG